jgi:hypothetical protein
VVEEGCLDHVTPWVYQHVTPPAKVEFSNP